MKKIYSAIALLVATTLSAQTQLENASFENWTPVEYQHNIYHSLDLWMPFTECSEDGFCDYLRRSEDAYDGDYALKLFTVDKGTYIGSPTIASLVRYYPPNGIPLTGRPVSASFYYKYDTDDDYGMYADVMLYRGGLLYSIYDVIAKGEVTVTEPSSEWKRVEFQLTYEDDRTPDFAYIHIGLKEGRTTAHDTLMVDYLQFQYSTTDLTHEEPGKNLSISCQDGRLSFSQPLNNGSLLDARGMEVMYWEERRQDVAVGTLAPGIYVVNAQYEGRVISKRICIQ